MTDTRFKPDPNSMASRMLVMLETGQWTTRQIAAYLGCPIRDVASAITQQRHLKKVHRCGFTIHMPGDRGGPQALYTIGWADEAKHPKKLAKAERDRRYHQRARERKRRKTLISSVFQLGERYR